MSRSAKVEVMPSHIRPRMHARRTVSGAAAPAIVNPMRSRMEVSQSLPRGLTIPCSGGNFPVPPTKIPCSANIRVLVRKPFASLRDFASGAAKTAQYEAKLEKFPDHFPVLSFSPGVARPAVDQTLLAWSCGVGTEVDHSLVRLSPFLSWTRGSQSTPDCRHGPSSVPEHAC